VNTGRTTFVSSSTRRIRRAAVAALAVAAVTLVGACGKDGKATRPFEKSGLAAEVGDERISTETLTSAVDTAEQAGQGKRARDVLTRDLLSLKIRLALYRKVAERMGVTVGDAEFAETRETLGKDPQIQQGGGLDKFTADQGFGKDEVTEIVQRISYERILGDKLVKDKPVTDEELKALFDANSAELDTAHTAHILVKDEALANKILAKLKAGGDFAALAKKYSIDDSNKGSGGDLGTNPRGKFVPEFDKAVFEAKTGDLLGPVKTQFGFHIIKVIERASFESVKESMRTQAGERVGSDRLKVEVDKAIADEGLQVNPRFGKWDGKTYQVVADDSSDAPSSPTSAPGSGGTPAPSESPAN
jgi:parvulin-like peptidyl-prolyl isomerase